MISNDLFEETNENIFFLKYFTINYVLNFLYIIFNKNSSMKNFSLKKYIIAKQKLKILWFCMCDKLHMQTCLCVYLCMHMWSYACQGIVCISQRHLGSLVWKAMAS